MRFHKLLSSGINPKAKKFIPHQTWRHFENISSHSIWTLATSFQFEFNFEIQVTFTNIQNESTTKSIIFIIIFAPNLLSPFYCLCRDDFIWTGRSSNHPHTIHFVWKIIWFFFFPTTTSSRFVHTECWIWKNRGSIFSGAARISWQGAVHRTKISWLVSDQSVSYNTRGNLLLYFAR